MVFGTKQLYGEKTVLYSITGSEMTKKSLAAGGGIGWNSDCCLHVVDWLSCLLSSFLSCWYVDFTYHKCVLSLVLHTPYGSKPYVLWTRVVRTY